jgi:hypothetical protein
MRKKLRITALILFIFVGVLIVVALFRNHLSKQSLARYKLELSAKGEKLKFSDFMRPPSTNAAHIASRKVFQTVEFDGSEIQPMAMHYTSAGKARVGWLGKLYLEPTNDDESVLIGDWPTLEQEIKENASKLQPFIAALLDPAPDSGWLFKDDFDDSVKYDIPNRTVEFRVGRALQMLVLTRLHDGNFEQAVSNLYVLINLTQLYHNEPNLICQLIRVSNAARGLQATWEALQATNWDGAGLSKLQQKWEAVELLDGLEKSFLAERANKALAMQMLRAAKPDELINMFAIIEYNPDGTRSRSLTRGKFWRDTAIPLLYGAIGMDQDELFQLRFYQEALAASRALKSNNSVLEAEKLLSEASENATRELNAAPRYRLFASKALMSTRLGGSILKVGQAETFRRLAITAIAIRRYQLGHNSTPRDLQRLAPEFLSSVPIDLMSGKPLCYRLNPDGSWMLYSVGVDGKDDGGDPRPVTSDGKLGLWEGRDSLWPAAVMQEEEAPRDAAASKK